MVRIAILFISLLALQACKTYKANDLPQKRIELGSGGGFTGYTETYYLLRNGQVFYKHSLDSLPKSYNKIKRSQAKAFFKYAHKTLIPNIGVSESGNLYYTLKIMDKDTLSYIWANRTRGAEKLDSVYHKISKAIIKPTP